MYCVYFLPSTQKWFSAIPKVVFCIPLFLYYLEFCSFVHILYFASSHKVPAKNVFTLIFDTNGVNNEINLNSNVNNCVHGADTDGHPTDRVVRKSWALWDFQWIHWNVTTTTCHDVKSQDEEGHQDRLGCEEADRQGEHQADVVVRHDHHLWWCGGWLLWWCWWWGWWRWILWEEDHLNRKYPKLVDGDDVEDGSYDGDDDAVDDEDDEDRRSPK